MRPNQVKLIAEQLGVTEQDVIDMNRRLGGDASLNAPIREDGDTGEWQDSLVDESASQETVLVESDELDNRRKALASALSVLNNRERRIFEARRLTEEPITLKELADEFGVSRERVRQIDVTSFVKVPEDGQEPRRRDGGSTGGWKCHNGYVSREPNDIRDDDKAVRAAYFRMVCQHRAERKSAVLTHFDGPKLP